jgi:hypothetical protein
MRAQSRATCKLIDAWPVQSTALSAVLPAVSSTVLLTTAIYIPAWPFSGVGFEQDADAGTFLEFGDIFCKFKHIF